MGSSTSNVETDSVLNIINGQIDINAEESSQSGQALDTPSGQQPTLADQPAAEQAKPTDQPEELSYKEIKVRGDGYCFFRCLLLQNTKKKEWADCDSNTMYEYVQANHINDILQAIGEANNALSQIYTLSFQNQDLNTELSNPERLIEHTIKQDGGFIWSPKGICVCCNPQIDYDSLSERDLFMLETFCDSVFESLKNKLNLNTDKSKGSYAEAKSAHFTWHCVE